MIYNPIEENMRTRVLHLEPGFSAVEYLEEMLGRFMKARIKEGA